MLRGRGGPGAVHNRLAPRADDGPHVEVPPPQAGPRAVAGTAANGRSRGWKSGGLILCVWKKTLRWRSVLVFKKFRKFPIMSVNVNVQIQAE